MDNIDRQKVEEAESIEELVNLIKGLKIERLEHRIEYEKKEKVLDYLITEAQSEIDVRRRSLGIVEAVPGITPATTVQATPVAATVQSSTADQEDQGELVEGDYVIITSKTGGLRGRRARITEVKQASYILKVEGQNKPIRRLKGSVRRPNRNGF